MSREIPADDASGVMHIAAPIQVQGRIAGVLTVAKPVRTVQRFIDRAERKVLMGGLLLLALSAAVGVAVTLWMVWNVRRLRDYALSVQGPADGEHHEPGAPPTAALAVPEVPGELGDLARAMDRMRARLEGRDYIEGYVRALTHELKSPVAAIRGQVLARTQPVLLGVNAAMVPELTGQQNVRLGCLAMGMTPEQAAAAYRDIVELSGLGPQIHHPMKTYSSGMGARCCLYSG